VIKARKATQVCKVQPDCKDPLEIKVRRVQLVIRVQPDHKDRLAIKDHRGQLGIKVRKVTQALMVQGQQPI
jgi:hypothetical protein